MLVDRLRLLEDSTFKAFQGWFRSENVPKFQKAPQIWISFVS